MERNINQKFVVNGKDLDIIVSALEKWEKSAPGRNMEVEDALESIGRSGALSELCEEEAKDWEDTANRCSTADGKECSEMVAKSFRSFGSKQ